MSEAPGPGVNRYLVVSRLTWVLGIKLRFPQECYALLTAEPALWPLILSLSLCVTFPLNNFFNLNFYFICNTVSVVCRPLDFLGTFSNRWSYGVAFGATANKIMFLFSEGYQPLEVPQWAQGTRPTSHILGMLTVHTCSQRPRGLSKGINSVSSHILLGLSLTQSQCLVAHNASPS